jgi:hypothetical protein
LALLAFDPVSFGKQHETLELLSALVALEFEYWHCRNLSAAALARRLTVRTVQLGRWTEMAGLYVDSTEIADHLHCKRVDHYCHILHLVGFVSVAGFVQNQSHIGTASTESAEKDPDSLAVYQFL